LAARLSPPKTRLSKDRGNRLAFPEA